MKALEIEKILKSLGNSEKSVFFLKFFKAGKGEYAEGDTFLGISVPEQRVIAKHHFQKVPLSELQILLESPFHEVRLTALFMLILKYERSKLANEKDEIVSFYLKNIQYVNNWDLVDSTAYKILGRHCYERKNIETLLRFAKSSNLWENRVAVVATLYFIKKQQFDLTKEIVLINLKHPHDLMHKANGWMLREMGKQKTSELIDFLKEHYREMPRTSLRYAIEKLDTFERNDFLSGKV